MSREIGADPDALKAFAQRLHQAASEVDGMYVNIRGTLHAFEWIGPDADAIRSEWDTSARRTLVPLAAYLRSAAAHMAFEAGQQISVSQGNGAGPRTARASTGSGDSKPVTVVKYWDKSVDLSGGEVVVGGTSAEFRIEQLSNGKFQVVETFKGDAGVGAKLGFADGSGTAVITATSTYGASSLKNAQQIQRALEIRTVAAVNPGSESAAMFFTRLPEPESISVVSGVEGSIAAGTPGILLTSSKGAYGSSAADASATVDIVGGVTMTPGHATVETVSFGIAAGIGAAETMLGGAFGQSAAGEGNLSVETTVTMDGTHVASVSVDGTLDATGSTGLDFAGMHFGPTPPNDSIAVAFQADINVANAPPEIQQLVLDLQAGNGQQAEAALKQLLAHGVQVNYQVYEGDSSSLRVDAGPVEFKGVGSTMHQIRSGQVTV